MTYKEAKTAKDKMIPCFYTDNDGESHEVFIESVDSSLYCIIVGNGVGRVRIGI